MVFGCFVWCFLLEWFKHWVFGLLFVDVLLIVADVGWLLTFVWFLFFAGYEVPCGNF